MIRAGRTLLLIKRRCLSASCFISFSIEYTEPTFMEGKEMMLSCSSLQQQRGRPMSITSTVTWLRGLVGVQSLSTAVVFSLWILLYVFLQPHDVFHRDQGKVSRKRQRTSFFFLNSTTPWVSGKYFCSVICYLLVSCEVLQLVYYSRC